MAHREAISNAVENIAFRLAESRNGIITPAELLPFLPVSLGMIIDILNEAAAESDDAITAETVDGLRRYVFLSVQPGGATLSDSHCVACDTDSRELLCEECGETLGAALKAEAETKGWPAQAVYEHEVAYLAARIGAPVSAEKLASVSRFTLRRMRRKLELMQQVLAVRKERDMETSVLRYIFPSAPYPREQYLQNMKLIRSLPASITEEVEARVVHILTALGILFLILLGLAFWGFPFPLLFIAFLITSPILAVVLWKRRSKLDSMEVE